MNLYIETAASITYLEIQLEMLINTDFKPPPHIAILKANLFHHSDLAC